MIEAVDRLSVALAAQALPSSYRSEVDAIFLVGPAGTPLHILKDNGRETWAVDPRIQIIPTAYLPGQTHAFHAQNGALIVDTRSAYSLDFWTLDQGGNPANLHEMLLLENLLASIQATQFLGNNPAQF